MGNIIKWQTPDTTQVSYDYVEIYRANSEGGSYSLIATQVIADNSYFDIDGGSNHWYKVRFKDESESKYSGYSKPIRGGTAHGYCTIDDLRLLTGLTSTDVNDSDLLQIQKYAITQLNNDIGSWFINGDAERILYISAEKENDVDGINTVFYVREVYIGDKNCDGLVDADDVYAFSINASGDRTEYGVSTVDAELGKVTLGTAPTSGDLLFFEYVSVPRMEDPAHMTIKLATSALVAALASVKINPNNADSFRVGKIMVRTSSGPFTKHMERYQQYVQNLKRKLICRGTSHDIQWGDLTI